MVSIIGIYQNGKIKFEKEFLSKNPIKVIVTFLEEVQNTREKGLSLSDFSFSKSRKNLKNFKGSFSDCAIEEREEEL